MIDGADDWVSLGEALEVHLCQLVAARVRDPDRDPRAVLGWAPTSRGRDLGELVAELHVLADRTAAEGMGV